MTDGQKQFVIQEHTRNGDIHWDLMLEQSGSLRTFRLDTPPGQLLTKPARAVKIANHDLRFLTYQGPVNKGAGNVRIVESGTYSAANQTPGRIELKLNGTTFIKGCFLLEQIENDNWKLSSEPITK
jgi:hypothetical protein